MFDFSNPKFLYLQNFAKDKKCINLRPKVPYLGIFELELIKTIAIFEIATFEFVYLQNFAKKNKNA